MDVSKAATKLPTLENRSLIENFIAYTQWAFFFHMHMHGFITLYSTRSNHSILIHVCNPSIYAHTINLVEKI